MVVVVAQRRRLLGGVDTVAMTAVWQIYHRRQRGVSCGFLAAVTAMWWGLGVVVVAAATACWQRGSSSVVAAAVVASR